MRRCRRRTTAIGAELGAAFVIGVGIIVLAPILGPGLLLLFGAVIVALLIGTSWYYFTQQKLLIDFTFPLLSSLLIYLTLVFTNYVREQAQRRQIRSAFGQYLSPAAGRAARAVAGEAGARRRAARDDDHVQRRARLHHHLGNLQGRPAGPDRADEQLPDAADQRHHRPQGHHRQIHGRRDHGVLERAARRSRPTSSTPARPRSTCSTASTRSTASARQAAKARQHAVRADPDRRRHQHRQVRGRQHGLRPALRLFGAGRQRQSRVAPRRPMQVLRPADHPRLAHREHRQGQVRHARTRFHRGEGQEGAGGGLRDRRPRGHGRAPNGSSAGASST